ACSTVTQATPTFSGGRTASAGETLAVDRYAERPREATRAQRAPDGVAGTHRAQGSAGVRRALPPDLSASVRGGAAYIEGSGSGRGGPAGEFCQHLAPGGVVRRRQEPTADVVDQHRPQSLPGSTAPARSRHRNHGR